MRFIVPVQMVQPLKCWTLCAVAGPMAMQNKIQNISRMKNRSGIKPSGTECVPVGPCGDALSTRDLAHTVSYSYPHVLLRPTFRRSTFFLSDRRTSMRRRKYSSTAVVMLLLPIFRGSHKSDISTASALH